MNSHCIGRLWPNIHNKMQYLNFDVDLIVTNEYGEKITIPPFTLQIFIHDVRNFKLIQHLHKKMFGSLQIWSIDNTQFKLVEVLPKGKNLAMNR
jgi:hypothetical protein